MRKSVDEMCRKIDNCGKIDMLKDKDLPDELFARYAREICRICPERLEQSDTPRQYEVRERVARFFHDRDFKTGKGDMAPSFDECPQAVKQSYYEEADQILAIVEDFFKKDVSA